MTKHDKRYGLNVALNKEAREAIDALAESRQVFAGDILREALADYLKRLGIDVEVYVDRGGYRPRKESAE